MTISLESTDFVQKFTQESMFLNKGLDNRQYWPLD